MQTKKLLICLTLAFLMTSCTLQTPNHTQQDRDLPQSQIQHIVIIWLREPGNVSHRQTLIKASQQLTEIPGVISVEGGEVITDNRPVVDSSFDVALSFRLQDKQALREYVQHPLHKKLLKDVFKPLIEHYRVYDVELHLFKQ